MPVARSPLYRTRCRHLSPLRAVRCIPLGYTFLPPLPGLLLAPTPRPRLRRKARQPAGRCSHLLAPSEGTGRAPSPACLSFACDTRYSVTPLSINPPQRARCRLPCRGTGERGPSRGRGRARSGQAVLQAAAGLGGKARGCKTRRPPLPVGIPGTGRSARRHRGPGPLPWQPPALRRGGVWVWRSDAPEVTRGGAGRRSGVRSAVSPSPQSRLRLGLPAPPCPPPAAAASSGTR